MLGDIEPITAQEFIRQMEEILKEERKNQTNEKWFDTLSTEEKAKELQLIYISGRTDEFYDKPQKTVRKFIQWLKQPHREE